MGTVGGAGGATVPMGLSFHTARQDSCWEWGRNCHLYVTPWALADPPRVAPHTCTENLWPRGLLRGEAPPPQPHVAGK